MVNLYTIVMSFREGTYIAQVEADGLREALEKWPAQLNIDEVEGLTNVGYGELSRLIATATDNPSRLVGLRSVWYTDILVDGELMGLNIVKTAH